MRERRRFWRGKFQETPDVKNEDLFLGGFWFETCNWLLDRTVIYLQAFKQVLPCSFFFGLQKTQGTATMSQVVPHILLLSAVHLWRSCVFQVLFLNKKERQMNHQN